MGEIILPIVRNNLIGHLEALSDFAYQHRAWINKDFPPGIEYDEPDLVIHFLYDETGLADDPEGGLKDILRNQKEVVAIKKVIEKLDVVMDNFDVGFVNPAEYVSESVPEWRALIEAAQEALIVFQEDDSPNEKP